MYINGDIYIMFLKGKVDTGNIAALTTLFCTFKKMKSSNMNFVFLATVGGVQELLAVILKFI